MITENLSTLKIHNLTQEQYDRELAAGRIDENALYLTPYEEQVQSDWSQNDSSAPDYVKNRTHYEEVIEESIEGLEYTVPFRHDTSAMSGELTEHNLNIPLQLGHVWSCILIQNGNETSAVELEVQQDEDGVLYLGDLDPRGNPHNGWRVNSNSSEAKADFVWNGRFYAVKITGVSGTITGDPIIHKLDKKYLPNMEEDVIETLAEADMVNVVTLSDGSMLADENGNVLSF